MKKFTFPLERVLQYRKLQLESEHARLEQCAARLHSIERMEAELQRQKFEAEQGIREQEAPRATVRAHEVDALSGYRYYVRRVGVQLAQRRAEAAHDLAQQRAALLDARRKYEILNRCREEAVRDWKYGFNREQESIAGELYLARWKVRRG
jgi:hypothetical protein